MSQDPQHGDSREHHYEDEAGNRVHVFGAGAVHSVCENYCAGCKTWVRVEGVTGALKFMAEHGDHKS